MKQLFIRFGSFFSGTNTHGIQCGVFGTSPGLLWITSRMLCVVFVCRLKKGAPGAIRTPNLLIRSQVLCPLSYGGKLTYYTANLGREDNNWQMAHGLTGRFDHPARSIYTGTQEQPDHD
jgi:hypothetical protein